MTASANRSSASATSHRDGWFSRIAAWCNASPASIFSLLSVSYIALIWKAAHRPLWYDELYTYYIAQQPSWTRLLQAIHAIDLNPPLNYALTRWSIAIFGSSPWAARLPAIAAFWFASLAIFLFLKKKTSVLIASVAVLLFWSTPYFSYATEARPYALLLAFSAWLLYAWDEAANGDRKFALPLLLFTGFALLLSHVFGVLTLGAIWLGEAVRSWRRRRTDWPVAAALLLPLVAVATYSPMFHAFRATMFPADSQASLAKLAFLYYATFRWMWRPLLAIAVVAFLSRRQAANANITALPPEFATTYIALFLIPLSVTLIFMRSHGAFYDRYGMVAVLPLVLTVAILLHRSTQSRTASLVALICVGFLLLLSTGLRVPLDRAVSSVLPGRSGEKLAGILTTSIHGPFRPWWKKLPVPPSIQSERSGAPLVQSLETFDPELPIVAASELTFFEMDNRESSAVTTRLNYLYDRRAEIEISHRSVADGVLEARDYFPLRANIADYHQFIDEHRTFLVVGLWEHPGDWLLRKAASDGATITVAGQIQAYADTDIYLITFPAIPR